MGTMKCRFMETFIFLALIISGQAILPHSEAHGNSLQGKEDRVGYPSTSESSSLNFSRRTCIYASADLPACNFENDEDVTESVKKYQNKLSKYFDKYIKYQDTTVRKHFGHRRKFLDDDNVDVDLTVYVIEGCLPSRLPFHVPFCKNADAIRKATVIQKLYPFSAKGVPKVPMEFPEFDLDWWMRAMKKLPTQKYLNVRKGREVKVNEDPHRRNTLPKAAKRKQITPTATIPNTYVSKGSPLSFIFYPETNYPIEETENEDDLQENLKDFSFQEFQSGTEEVPTGLLRVIKNSVPQFPHSKEIVKNKKWEKVRSRIKELQDSDDDKLVIDGDENMKLPNVEDTEFTFWRSISRGNLPLELHDDGSEELRNFDDEKFQDDKSKLSSHREIPFDPYNLELRGVKNLDKELETLNGFWDANQLAIPRHLGRMSKIFGIADSNNDVNPFDDTSTLENLLPSLPSSRKRRNVRQGSEFPYSIAIPYDPKKLEYARRIERLFDGEAGPLRSRKARSVIWGSEFPYWEAIPYDTQEACNCRQTG